MKNKRITYGNSQLIWFDYNNLDLNALENIVVSNFDITNMPVEFSHRDINGNNIYSPKPFELKNYHVSFFADPKSSTGYSCMCINNDRAIYKSGEGYINDFPKFNEY